MGRYLILENNISVSADEKMNNETVKNLWYSFTLKNGKISFNKGEKFAFLLRNTQLPTLSNGKEYALKVNEYGAAIVGKDYAGLIRGFISLLMKIECDENVLKIKEIEEESDYKITNRMIHICVFPENDFYYIKKLIRFIGLCQYTHVVIEFWGMFKYDCLKELSWPHAFTKSQVKEFIKECRELGLEPIPMFNQLGHASASRICYGKHVVLDQNPQLQNLFTPDGWAWNIKSTEIFSLFKTIRNELYEVFGEGEYIHIGCDEAYYITRNVNLRKELPHYLKKLTKEVEKEGRRPMVWMDMLLEEGAFKNCYTTGKKDEVVKLRNSTAKSTVFVDWQYDYDTSPIPTLISLKDCGYDTIGAPWFNEKNYNAHIETITKNNFYGIMMTTWNTLKDYMHSILGCAKKCGAKTFVWSEYSDIRSETATMLRRISFEGNNYADSGWSNKQIKL